MTNRASWKTQWSAALFGAAGAFVLVGLIMSNGAIQYSLLKGAYSLGLLNPNLILAGTLPAGLPLSLPLYALAGLNVLLGLLLRWSPARSQRWT